MQSTCDRCKGLCVRSGVREGKASEAAAVCVSVYILYIWCVVVSYSLYCMFIQAIHLVLNCVCSLALGNQNTELPAAC